MFKDHSEIVRDEGWGPDVDIVILDMEKRNRKMEQVSLYSRTKTGCLLIAKANQSTARRSQHKLLGCYCINEASFY